MKLLASYKQSNYVFMVSQPHVSGQSIDKNAKSSALQINGNIKFLLDRAEFPAAYTKTYEIFIF